MSSTLRRWRFGFEINTMRPSKKSWGSFSTSTKLVEISSLRSTNLPLTICETSSLEQANNGAQRGMADAAPRAPKVLKARRTTANPLRMSMCLANYPGKVA